MTAVSRADQLSSKDSKSSQRERLLAAMTELCAAAGYRDTTIADVIANAGVSRATFYEYFSDKDDCLLAAQRSHATALTAHLERTIAATDSDGVLPAAVTTLLRFAGDHPDATQLLTRGCLAAGGTAASRYDAMLADLGTVVERATPDHGYLVAIPVLLAGMYRALWPHLHTGETEVSRFETDLMTWMASYRLPGGIGISSHFDQAHTPSSPFLPDPPLTAPKPLPPGRRVLPVGEVTRNRRERILYATADAAAEVGYLAITVDDIVARAQIARRAFYQHFADIDDAFLGVLEFFAQPLLASTATAFFATNPWPQRAWDAALALLDFLTNYPSIAHAMWVDSDAGPASATRSIQATERTLTLLLEEGYRQGSQGPPSRLTSDLVLATVSELASRRLRDGEGELLVRHLPQFGGVILTPFLGAAATVDFLQARAGGA
jgi:AcrR family transcriptional regulator